MIQEREQIPLIHAESTQLGVAVEASIDNGKTWVCVQLTPFRTRKNGVDGQRPYQTWIDQAGDVEDYFTALDKRGVKYKRVREKL